MLNWAMQISHSFHHRKSVSKVECWGIIDPIYPASDRKDRFARKYTLSFIILIYLPIAMK
jgi:hypothetical protein